MSETRTAALRAQIAALDTADFGPDITEEMGDPAKAYTPPTHWPTEGMHPRLLLRAEDIPAVRAAMADAENAPAAAEMRRLAESECDGILPPPWDHESGRKGEHNFDNDVLAAIQAKALCYLIDGNEVRGLESVYAMLNFIRTLDIRWIICDHCREYGFAAYIAACVYDWCYPLMDADSRFKMIAGLEHRFFRGTVNGSPKALCGTAKMEAGFPPVRQGVCTGHGSEMQILRDYLAVAAAIYDEHPGWWAFIAGRVYNEYVPVRNVYYRGGLVPQGTPSYGTWRYMGDMYSAWILRSVTGEIPYIDNMHEVVRSFIARETADSQCLKIGDIYSTVVTPQAVGSALITSYLYKDPMLRAYAIHCGPGMRTFGTGFAHILAAESLILSSGGIRAAKTHRTGMPCVTYNGYPFGEIVSRNRWDAPDTAVVLTKIGERITANHDHADAGNFMIYYKGMLADDSGLYAGYGSDHHNFYHRATAAHNCLLVYNPKYHDDAFVYDEQGRPTNRDRYWYAGGQNYYFPEPQYLHTWMDPIYDTGRVTGVRYAEHPAGGADYTYISGDLSAAYHADTVEFMRRSMLTVYTDDPAHPVLLFVADRIDACDPSFKKTFLLQAVTEPTIDAAAKSARISNGAASLTITSVIGGDEITAYGGEGKTFYISARGENCSTRTGVDGPNWGHVEISPKPGEKSDRMLHLLCVSDGEEAALPVTALCGDDYDGALCGGICAVFAADRRPAAKPITFKLPEAARCFVGGIARGSWKICADGAPIGTAAASHKDGLLVFDAPAGEITVIPE